MKTRFAAIALTLAALSVAPAVAQIGAGNGNAIALAKKSPAVQTAFNFLISQAQNCKTTICAPKRWTRSPMPRPA